MITCILICSLAFLHAQTITGTIKSGSDGGTLPGVSILVKGTNIGTVSDMDGNFSLQAAPQSTLIFSYIGYLTQEIAIGSQTVLDVTMSESAESLDEIVVTALGIRKEAKSSDTPPVLCPKNLSLKTVLQTS